MSINSIEKNARRKENRDQMPLYRRNEKTD
jgi:hypothetical protein